MNEHMDWDVVVHLNGGFCVVPATKEGVPGVVKLLMNAMDDSLAGKDPYYCQLNQTPDIPGVYLNVFLNTCVEGYYLRQNLASPAERSVELQEKTYKLLEKQAKDIEDGEDWKTGGGDG